MRSRWEDKIREMGLNNHFIFTGHVPYRDVPDYIGAMDICVAPHHAETNQASPVKLFDYMAAGRPIVASDIEVVREIVRNSNCAFLIPPNDKDALVEAIISLLNDDILRADMSSKGRKLAVEKFDRRHLTEELFSSFLNI
jgi:glycosyltransferase involved in cell wall biosynthesis